MPKDTKTIFQTLPRGAGTTPAKARRPGRPALGPGGERVSDYPPVMIRLPQDTKDTLAALSAVTGVPVWQLVDRAVSFYVAQLPSPKRKLVTGVKASRARVAPNT